MQIVGIEVEMRSQLVLESISIPEEDDVGVVNIFMRGDLQRGRSKEAIIGRTFDLKDIISTVILSKSLWT